MEQQLKRKLFLAYSDGKPLQAHSLELVAAPRYVEEPMQPAERAAYEAVWRQAEADAAELRADAARYRAEQLAKRAADWRFAVVMAQP